MASLRQFLFFPCTFRQFLRTGNYSVPALEVLRRSVKTEHAKPGWQKRQKTEDKAVFGAGTQRKPSDRLDRLWAVKQTVAHNQRQLVLQRPKYSNSVVKMRKIDVNLLGTRSLSDELRSELERAKNKDYVSGLEDDELINLLSNIANLWHSGYWSRQKRLLEKECSARISKFDVDTMLWVADAFFITEHKFQLYIRSMLQRVAEEWTTLSLTTPQVVHLLFFVGIHRDMPTDLSYYIEEFLLQNISDLTGNELGLVSHAFFASNYRIKDFRLVQGIATSLLQSNMSHTQPFMIGNILKALKHAQYTEVHFYEQLGDFLTRPSVKMPSSALMHVAMAFGSARVLHPKLFDKITAELVRYADSNKDVWFKTFSRIMWTMAMLQHPCPDKVTNTLLGMLRTERQLMLKYPQHVFESLQALMIKGIYPQDLIDFALSEKFRKAVRFESDYQFALLAEAPAIECPEYKSSVSSNEGVGDLEHELLGRKGLMSLYVTLQDLLPHHEMVRCHFALKHSKIADIELQVDADNRAVKLEQTPLSQELQSLMARRRSLGPTPTTGSIIDTVLREAGESLEGLISSPGTVEPSLVEDRHILPSVETEQRKILIKLHSWNQYVANAPHLLGHHQMELRLLSQLGYELYLVNPTRAKLLDGLDHAECKEFVKTHILERLNIQLPEKEK